eukprot:TRINITY_DN14320_c0_g1_i1.p1 TRINITY_DN14320_c0_g1~~TRINITY_DN14320_c0_g1_i1.p1  ORF type:complete len:243 (+),score=52.40 TRINITY_DN14320_c0_g1_i1:100-828(+)
MDRKRATKVVKNATKEEPEDSEEESVSEESEDEVTSDSEEMTWVQWFCSLRGNEFFAEVDDEYIKDDFNLTGLASIVPNYEHALDMILDADADDLNEEQTEIVQSAAEMLYGLIHARFVLTSRGLSQMVDKYNNAEFGRCPRVYCQGQAVLPVGQSDIARTNTVKLFCPKCQDIYYPKYSRHASLDGGYFGTTFPHLFMQTYPELVPTKPVYSYVPRIFGFMIHKSSTNWPRPATKNKKQQH